MMKDKILLELYLPAVEKSFDIKVPRQLKVAHVTDMIIDFLQKKEGEFIPTKESVLCDMNEGKVLDANAFIDSVGLQDGSKIMLV